MKIITTREQAKMWAVDQETPTSCFRACVATLLMLRWSDVPNSFDGDNWDWDASQDWLAKEHGMQAIEIVMVDQPRIYPVRRVWCVFLLGKVLDHALLDGTLLLRSLSGLKDLKLFTIRTKTGRE